MIQRARDRFDLYPESLAADTAYGSADMLGWLVEDEGIEPHIPVFDKSERKDGAKDEFHLAAMVQNLRKLAKLVPQPA